MGDYERIRKIDIKERELKPETEKMYCLAAECNLPKLHSPFARMVEEKKIRLKSLQVMQNENSRVMRHERNMLVPSYFASIKEEDKRAVSDDKSLTLQPSDALISLNFYDSVNGEKQHEFVCHGKQTLLDLAKQFYCLIAKLENLDQQANYLDSYFLIEENFYFYGNNARQKIEEVIGFVNKNQEKEYYMGEETEMKSSPSKSDMSKASLSGLRVVFGRPYLYRHLEGCDHMVIFKDLRLFSPSSATDPNRKAVYPLVVFESKMKKRRCEACKAQFSSVVSLADPLKNRKTLYLCEECHHNLHSSSKAREDDNIFVKYIHD